MAYGDLKYLTRRTALIKYCVIKQLLLLKIQNMLNTKEVMLQWSINFSIKTLLAAVLCQNQQLTEELHKSIIRKFKKSKSTITFCRQYLGC